MSVWKVKVTEENWQSLWVKGGRGCSLGGGAVFFPKEKNIFWVLGIWCSFSIFQTLSFPEKMTSRRAFFHCFLVINKWIWQILKFRKKILEFRKVWESRRQFWGQIMGKLAIFALKSKKFRIFEFRFKIWLSLENLSLVRLDFEKNGGKRPVQEPLKLIISFKARLEVTPLGN